MGPIPRTWCEHQEDDPPAEDVDERISKWDMEFLNVDLKTIF